VIAATAITAMSAARSPYSMRSWPSHRALNSATTIQSRLMPSLRSHIDSFLCGRRQLRRDRLEDGIHARASRRQRRNGHERDEPDEQRILDQVLALILPHERNESIDYRHHPPPARIGRACVPITATPFQATN